MLYAASTAAQSNVTPEKVLVFALCLIPLVCVGAFKLWLMVCRPELHEAMEQRKHEREMAAAAARKAKIGGIFGGIPKAVIGAAVKGRPNH